MAGVADRALDGLGEGLRSLAGPLLDPLVRALAGPLEAADDLVTVPAGLPDVLAVPAILDLARTPHPQWFAQLAGVTVPVGMSTEDVRTLVRTRGVAQRGTPGAIIAAVRTALTVPTGTVRLTERDGSPWRLTVTTYSAQTPSTAAVLAALEPERPVGIVVHHVIRPGQTWGDVKLSGRTLGQLKTQTVREVREAVPPA